MSVTVTSRNVTVSSMSVVVSWKRVIWLFSISAQKLLAEICKISGGPRDMVNQLILVATSLMEGCDRRPLSVYDWPIPESRVPRVYF